MTTAQTSESQSLPDAEDLPDVTSMSDEELQRAKQDLGERIAHGQLTPEGRKELNLRYFAVKNEITRREENAQIVTQYQS